MKKGWWLVSDDIFTGSAGHAAGEGGGLGLPYNINFTAHNVAVVLQCPNKLACGMTGHATDVRNASYYNASNVSIVLEAKRACAPGYAGLLCAECDDDFTGSVWDEEENKEDEHDDNFIEDPGSWFGTTTFKDDPRLWFGSTKVNGASVPPPAVVAWWRAMNSAPAHQSPACARVCARAEKTLTAPNAGDEAGSFKHVAHARYYAGGTIAFRARAYASRVLDRWGAAVAPPVCVPAYDAAQTIRGPWTDTNLFALQNCVK